MKKVFILLLILIGFSCKNEKLKNTKTIVQFSKYDILYDIDYLKSSLENTHINLYAYTSKVAFEENYCKVKNEVKKDSFSILEATTLFQKVVSKANNGHTRIPFPIPSYISYAKSGGTLFPLEIAIENDKAIIRKNWSSNSNIKVGDELIGINGQSIQEILNKIYPQISAERIYFKHAQLENLTLPRFYWLVFGEQKNFTVEIEYNNKKTNYKLTSIKVIEDFEMKRNDILKHNMEFKSISNAVAYIQPGDFGGDLKKYKQFIGSTFTKINSKSYKNLIIDLRNHSGGDDAFGDYLVSYIADKPFKWTSRFQLKTSKQLKEHTRKHRDTTQAYWRSILKHKNGQVYDYDFNYYQPQSIKKRYKGEVYVLVNRQSYSQSTVTAAQIQDYGFGTIVGEETGEYPNLYASIYNYQLPKTGVSVDVSKGKINRVSGIDNNKGLIPDIIIKDHLLDEKDEILEKLLNLIINK